VALTQTFISTEDLGSNIVTVAKLALSLDFSDATRTISVKDIDGSSNGLQIANKNYVDNRKAASDAALAAEVSRATGVEAGLQSAIDAEVSARTSAVSAEAAARTAADTTLQNNINAEAATRTSADAALNQSISDEITRASGVEATLQSNIDTVQATLTAAITAESTRATAAEADEASARAAVDIALANDLAAEVTARTSAVSTEAAARVAGDTLLQSNLDSLQTSLNADIAAEESARIAADTLLQSNLDAEAATRASADTTLTNALAAEVTRAQGVEAAIRSEFAAADTNLDSTLRAYVDAQVAAEAALRSTADAGLAADISAEVARATAAEATLQANIDAGLQGLDVKESVALKTAFPLAFTPSSLTGVSVDGKSFVVGQRVLVTEPAAVMGIWDVKSGAWTRASDADSSPLSGELNAGAFTFVEADSTGWVLGADGKWVQFSGTGTYSVGNGLSLVGTQFSVNANMSEFMFDVSSKALLINAVNGSKLVNSSVQVNKLAPDVLRRLGQFDAEICEKVAGAPKRDFPLPGTVFADMVQGSVVVFVNGIKRRNASLFVDGDYSIVDDAGAAKVRFGYDIPVGAEFSVLFAKSSM
jgi:hypothetical protein